MIEFAKRSFGVKAGLPVRVWRSVNANGFVARKRFPARYAEKVWLEGKA